MGGSSIRFNPYIYAGANPTNYVDPNGECFFFGGIDMAICAAAALFGLGTGLDAGAQMVFEGRSWEEINWTRAGLSGVATVVGGGVGFVSGSLIRTAGFTGARALAAGGVAATVDFGVGAAADHYLLGDDWGTATFGNVLGFGIGEVAGYAGKGIAHGIGNVAQSGARFARQVNMNLAMMTMGIPSASGGKKLVGRA